VCKVISIEKNQYGKRHGWCKVHKAFYCCEHNVCGIAPTNVSEIPYCHECETPLVTKSSEKIITWYKPLEVKIR
jgi:hypothetical protein